MSAINTVVYVIHVFCVVTILILLLMLCKKNPRKLNPGILHVGLVALISGLAMVGMFSTVHPDEVLNNTKIGLKLLVLVAILIIGYRNVKKPELAKKTWLTLIGLTVSNILIATLWL